MNGGPSQGWRIDAAVEEGRRGAFASKLPRSIICRAWRVTESAAYPLPIGEADTLDEAISAALSCDMTVAHKDTLLVHIRDEGRKVGILHAFAVKRKSQPRYVRTDRGMKPEYDLYPAPMFVLSIYDFEPEKPFDAFSDDATGIDRSIVKCRA